MEKKSLNIFKTRYAVKSDGTDVKLYKQRFEYRKNCTVGETVEELIGYVIPAAFISGMPVLMFNILNIAALEIGKGTNPVVLTAILYPLLFTLLFVSWIMNRFINFSEVEEEYTDPITNESIQQTVIPMIANTETDDKGYRWLNNKDNKYINNIIKEKNKQDRLEEKNKQRIEIELQNREYKAKQQEENRLIEMQRKEELQLSNDGLNKAVNNYFEDKKIIVK